jgi:hypothetical protein
VFPLFATGVVETGINNTSGIGGKFAAGVVDYPQIFEKTLNDPYAIIRGLGGR